MEPESETQDQEITVLKSIYAEDFTGVPPTAWKTAIRLPQFNIKVQHPDSPKVSFLLNVKFPKKYPSSLPAIFAIEKPVGLNHEHITKLFSAITAEAKTKVGSVMVFEIMNFAQEWLTSNVRPPVEVQGSLALQMNKRSIDEELMRRRQREAELREENERNAKYQEQLQNQIQIDLQRKHQEKQRVRNRSNSEATEVPTMDETTETFNEMEFKGIHFNTVKYFHPQKHILGSVFVADPICEGDDNLPIDLCLFVVNFETQYYTTTAGRKKLKQLETEIRLLSAIRHPNVLNIFGVKLDVSSPRHPRLMILLEQAPPLTLRAMLEDTTCIREDRAVDYMKQVLEGLNAIHVKGLLHRGINTRCIGLTSHASQHSRVVRLCDTGFYTLLHDLNRSNPFTAISGLNVHEEPQLSNPWLSKDVKNGSALLYTRNRDIHSAGIVFLQMLIGLDVTDKYYDVRDVLKSVVISPVLEKVILAMLGLSKGKKDILSCSTLLAEQEHYVVDEGLQRSPVINFTPTYVNGGDPKTPVNMHYGSPETDYFRGPQRQSRWKEDWEELELLGRGGFGRVVKARNRVDNRIYAVKKIRLHAEDKKIYREINALSRLSHPHIVRYYTTWVEEDEGDTDSAAVSDASTSTDVSIGTEVQHSTGSNSSSGQYSGTEETDTEDGRAMTIDSAEFSEIMRRDQLSVQKPDSKKPKGSFPSMIEFVESRSGGDDSDSSGSEDGIVFRPPRSAPIPPRIPRMMYIQMEFVERQTLRERIDEGLIDDEEEGWRLFQQIVDALVHMSSLGILHRDIKLTNIFIDAKGDCKVGDFGLATSSLAAVDPSDKTPRVANLNPDMTLDVGTTLYMPPEVTSRRLGKDHTKADMYSLGIVFFEMNYRFRTTSERVSVLQKLRLPSVIFPDDWNPARINQQKIITWCMQENPDNRPNALELSQSSLVPHKLQDDYFSAALTLMVNRNTPHHEAVLSTLFQQPQQPSRNYLYDVEETSSQFASLDKIILDRIAGIFSLHGAIDTEPPLLSPAMEVNPYDEKDPARFIDRHGDIVILPSNLFHPFARLAARVQTTRIKRYFMTNLYSSSGTTGHPKGRKAAIFDIITRDAPSGLVAGPAEIISVASKVLDSFPNLTKMFDVHVSHSSIASLAFQRIPNSTARDTVLNIFSSKSSTSQKRALLLKCGVPRNVADELEILNETYADVDSLILRLDKISSSLLPLISSALDEMKKTISFSVSAGVSRPIHIRPLLFVGHQYGNYFQDGVTVAIVKRTKPSDILIAGGRYDHLISKYKYTSPTTLLCAFAMQLDVEEIKDALAKYQRNLIVTNKDQRSFGFWSPRRCDVYVVSQHASYLQDRLEIVSYLWQNNISADIMYEQSLVDGENIVDSCTSEGILFILYYKPRGGQYKIKSLMKGEDTEVARHDLIPWLKQEIAEQKRIDAANSGASTLVDNAPNPSIHKGGSVIQSVFPIHEVKQKKQTKNTTKLIFENRAYETSEQVRKTFLKSDGGMPTLVVDVPPAVYDDMIKSPIWITDDESWKLFVGKFPSGHSGYAQHIREAVLKWKEEGYKFIMLYASKEERMQLLQLY